MDQTNGDFEVKMIGPFETIDLLDKIPSQGCELTIDEAIKESEASRGRTSASCV